MPNNKGRRNIVNSYYYNINKSIQLILFKVREFILLNLNTSISPKCDTTNNNNSRRKPQPRYKRIRDLSNCKGVKFY